MARMQPELRRQELMEIAFRQFLQQGYENTSIRSIVGEAKGQIGMFYHHFSSKDDIFNAVLEQYNAVYVEKIKNIINMGKEASFWALMEQILLDLESSLDQYANMNYGAANTHILMTLHQNTLISLKPIFCELLDDYIGRGELSPPQIACDLLADFLLFGISAVIHGNREKSREAKREAIKELLFRLLGIPN